MPKSKISNKKYSGKQLAASFVFFFIIQSLVFYLANFWFPEAVVLGTHFYSSTTALFMSMIMLSLITAGASPFIECIADNLKIQLTNTHWVVAYFFVNFAGIWFVARFAETLGMGISSWMVAAVLAVVLDLLQGAVSRLVVRKIK